MIRIFLVFFLALAAATGHTAAEWPAHMVAIEEMKPLKPLRLSVPKIRPKGDVTGPVVLRVHVDVGGAVQRVALLESCGSPAHDEAALHAMRGMRFAPKLVNGVPADVTLVVPFHLPMHKAAAAA